MQTIVIGHRNPDMDSICSAIGYARLKQLSGQPDVIAARAGNTNERIDFVLEKFGVEPPVFIADLSPRVSDVMERKVISVRRDSSAYDAIHLIEQERLRGLPVIDEQNRCLGLLSAFRLSQQLVPARENAAAARVLEASLPCMVETFAGEVLAGKAGAGGAALPAGGGGDGGEIVFRTARQLRAGGSHPFRGRPGGYPAPGHPRPGAGGHHYRAAWGSPEHLRGGGRGGRDRDRHGLRHGFGRAAGARGGSPVGSMVSAELFTFSPDTLLDEAREKAAASRHFVFPGGG